MSFDTTTPIENLPPSSTSSPNTQLSQTIDFLIQNFKKEQKQYVESTGRAIKNDFNQKILDANQKIDNSQLKIIETLGIFVALFTFISVEFQIFKVYYHPLSLSGFTLIFLSCLLIFIIVLNFTIHENISFRKKIFKSGFLDSTSVVNQLRGEYKHVEFSLFKFRTWGTGFILLLFQIVLMVIGVFLLWLSPETNDFNTRISKVEENMKEIEMIDTKNLLYREDLDNLLYEDIKYTNLEQNVQNNTQIFNCLKQVGYFTKKCFEVQR